jgi:hypothetical protein
MSKDHHAVTGSPHVEVHDCRLVHHRIIRIALCADARFLTGRQRLDIELPGRDHPSALEAGATWSNIAGPSVHRDDTFLITANLGTDVDIGAVISECEFAQEVTREGSIHAANQDVRFTQPGEYITIQDGAPHRLHSATRAQSFDAPAKLKDLRKTCATYYDEHVPESSIEILRHSVGGITYRHYAHRAPPAYKAIMTLPQPTAFSALIKWSDGECPCCRRRFADAG